MTQSRVGVSVVSSLIEEVPVSAAPDPSLALLLPPLRFRATPLFRPGELGGSVFNNGASSMPDDVPLVVELFVIVGRGRRDAGIGLP